MARKQVEPSRAAADAVAVLGAQIRVARHERNWTAADLASRVGVGSRTITALERGAPGTAIGTVFTAAALVGVPLFGATDDELARLRRHGEERIAVIPSRTYKPRPTTTEVHDDSLDF